MIMYELRPRSCYPRGFYPPDKKVYDRLDLAGANLHVNVIRGTQGRAAMLRTVAEWGYPQRTVTPGLTRWGRIYVIQLGGDRDAGTVVLLGTHGPLKIRLGDSARHRVFPSERTRRLLAALLAEYPATSPTAALAEALDGVLHLCDHQRGIGQTIQWHDIERVLAAPLRAHLEAWDGTHPDLDDPTSTQKKDDAR
ncbi:MAG: hypothetical protein HKP61_00455 [Dactylosporangium sp.]|nr:hypothetical protein [Dactylosporangium sp.]NNJ59443.1 hypothetical protein [Dactylosporangium sp.]